MEMGMGMEMEMRIEMEMGMEMEIKVEMEGGYGSGDGWSFGGVGRVGGSVVSAWTVYSAFVVRSPRRSTDVPLCMAHSVRSA